MEEDAWLDPLAAGRACSAFPVCLLCVPRVTGDAAQQRALGSLVMDGVSSHTCDSVLKSAATWTQSSVPLELAGMCRPDLSAFFLVDGLASTSPLIPSHVLFFQAGIMLIFVPLIPSAARPDMRFLFLQLDQGLGRGLGRPIHPDLPPCSCLQSAGWVSSRLTPPTAPQNREGGSPSTQEVSVHSERLPHGSGWAPTEAQPPVRASVT